MPKSQRLPSLSPWSKWTPEVMRQEKERNPRMFARGFHMRAFSDDEKLFPHFESCFEHGVSLGDVQRRGLPVFIGVDLAGKTRPGNAIAVVGLDPILRRRYMLEIHYGNWRSPETAGRISEAASRYNTRFVMVENNAYQQSLVDWIRHEAPMSSLWSKIEPFTTGKNKSSPEYGLPSLEIEFKNKTWVIPASEFEGHPATCLCSWCHWVREFKDYPMAATSDGVMATWFAREAIDRWGGTGAYSSGVGDLNSR